VHFEYPHSLRTTTADDYHGHRIEDPYRWMEALDTPEVKAWIEAQNAVTDRYLASLPLRERLRARITELWNYAKVSLPVVENGRLFYQKNTGLEKQSAIYMRDRLNGPPALVLDPNALSPDGSVALMAFAPSPDARLLAYTLAEGGADWQTVHVRDLARGEDFADRVRWMRFSALSWTRDGRGFFYSRFPEPLVGRTYEAALSGHALYYQTRQMFATSRDGTRVPFFVTARNDLPCDGTTPAMMYGYGGFSVDMLPVYRPDVPAWLELGGMWVTVNLRGGSEYGEAWHRAGMREQKQNVFDDFIAVAERLIADGYTSASRLAMMGGSNGGLLVAVAMEQRPELVAAAVPIVGVLDMLRYDLFTGGRAWVTEYGSASDPEQFGFLRAYSPLHNLVDGRCYPATLVCTADYDDRVVPSHSFKFIAALQRAQGCERPVLIRVETQASHGYRPTDKRIAELADQWAFAAAHTGVPDAELLTSGSRPDE
jgi:prolyl oligopeptidase PreP (S9A serine peptidase family)